MFQQCPQCMTLLTVSNEELADNNSTITCEHCQARFTVTGQVDTPAVNAVNKPIIDDHAQANQLEAALQPSLTKNKIPLRWLIASLLLTLLLASQTTYFKRNELADLQPLRPSLQAFCQLLGCKLKLLRDTRQIRILARDVRSHPALKNALQIDLTMRNEAPFSQPWPTLQLSFSDINGQIIAQRSFSPKEYLSASYNLIDGMPPGLAIHTQMVLIDPSKNAVNYTFNFL